MRKNGIITALCLGTLIGLTVLAGCGTGSETAKVGPKNPDGKPASPIAEPSPGNAQAKKPPLVKAAPARRQDLVRTVELTGDVAAATSVTVRAMVDGPISFCPWREGDTVRRNETLIEIDRPLYRDEVRSAEAALAVGRAKLADLKAGARPEEIAQAAAEVKQLEASAAFADNDLKRIEQMVTSGSMPGEALEKARVAQVRSASQLAVAREKLGMLRTGPTATAVAVQEALVQESAARLEKARGTLAECVLQAPFDGVVSRVHVRPGDLATARGPLLDLLEKDSLVVRFGVPEAYSAAVREGAPVALAFDALPGRRFETAVARAYPEIDPRTRTRLAEAGVDAAWGAAPGMFARVVLTVDRAEGALAVPEAAVLTDPRGDRFVFVFDGGRALRRIVRTGLEAGGLVQILEGVQATEQVITAGHETLKDGAAVRLPEPKPASPSGAGDER